MPAVGFEPTTPQSLSGGVTPRLTHRLNHLATEDWMILQRCQQGFQFHDLDILIKCNLVHYVLKPYIRMRFDL